MRNPLTIPVSLALLAAAAAGQAPPPGGPFMTRNEQVLHRLYGLPPGEAPAPAPAAGVQAGIAVDVANHSYEKFRGTDELVLDGETWCLRFAARYGWTNGWRVSLQIPLVAHRGGGTDGFIERYHDALGLPQGNREWREPHRLEHRYRHRGDLRFNLTEPAEGLGDVRVAVAAPLWRDRASGRAVEAVAGVELPTGDPDQLLGSGSTDVSLGLAACDPASLARWRLELAGAAGLLVLTPGELLADRQEHLAGYGSLSAGWRLADWLEPRLQVDAHSPIFSGTGMPALDDWAVQLVSGARVRLPAGYELDIAVSEDLILGTSPDVVFHFNLRRSL